MDSKTDFWMQASSTVTQRISEDNVGQVVIIDNIDGARGITLDPLTSTFTVEQDSDYLVVAAPQVGRKNPGESALRRQRSVLRAPALRNPRERLDQMTLLHRPPPASQPTLAYQNLSISIPGINRLHCAVSTDTPANRLTQSRTTEYTCNYRTTCVNSTS